MSLSDTLLFERDVPGTRAELATLMDLLQGARALCGLDEGAFFTLVTAMTEAVNNAITHGNGGDPALHVRYSARCTERGVECSVEDQGPGFDPDHVADPTSPDHLLSEGGRGIFLIRALTHNLSFERTERGMRITFLCPRTADAI